MLLVDASNAFNRMNRMAALHNIRIICPKIAVASRSDEVDPEDPAITSLAEGVEAKVEPSDHKIVLSDDIWCRVLKKVKPLKDTSLDQKLKGLFSIYLTCCITLISQGVQVLIALSVAWNYQGMISR